MAGQIVVTGGTGGLGSGVVRVLVESGARPIVTWVSETERDRASEVFGDAIVLEALDVGDPEATVEFAERVGRSGRLRGLVHLVGGYLDNAPIGGMEMAGWDLQVELNLRLVAVMMRAVLPPMRRAGFGRVVVIGGRAGVHPFAGAAAYSASKAGVSALVAAAAQEERDAGVTVNALLPSVINTPANRGAMPDADHDRWVQPEEIGHVVLFLLSPEASGVTGASIPVYGRV